MICESSFMENLRILILSSVARIINNWVTMTRVNRLMWALISKLWNRTYKNVIYIKDVEWRGGGGKNIYEYSVSMANLHVLSSWTKLNKSKTLGGNFVKMSKMTKLKGINCFII